MAAAFSTFQEGKALSSAQLRFLNEIVDYLAHNGAITVEALYHSPFNSIAPGGPEDLFGEGDIEAIVTTMQSVDTTAVPA